MKPMVLFLAFAFLFLGADLAYGLGGGGSRGDGRVDFVQKPSANEGSAITASAQAIGGGQADPPADAVVLSVSVPEPVTLLLLGSALIGLVGFRRKVGKCQ